MALDQYTRALNLDADNLEALQGLARLAHKHPAQLEDLLPVARAFVERHDRDAIAIATLASLLDEAEDLGPAERLYRRAIELDPHAAWLHNNLGFNLLLQARMADAA